MEVFQGDGGGIDYRTAFVVDGFDASAVRIDGASPPDITVYRDPASGQALVVLSGTDPQGQEGVRLTRAAREGGSALVSLTTASALSSLRVSSSLDPKGYQWHRTPFGEPAVAHDVLVRVRARAMGWNAHSQFLVPILHHELRLSLESGIPDRRGTKR